ncbi:MAG: alginate export family protein [Rikenellaceae bacterium]
MVDGQIFKMMNKYLISLFLTVFSGVSFAQSNNPLSIYEGERVEFVTFDFASLPKDTLVALNISQKIENTYKIYPNMSYSSFMSDYYISQIGMYPFVEKVTIDISEPNENGISIKITVTLTENELAMSRNENIFKNRKAFPNIYTDSRSFLTFKFSSSEMIYSNNNAWFGQPKPILTGNPLVHNPEGDGYYGWLEGFAMAGIYGISKIIPRYNIHLYGGASYMVSFSCGREMFSDKSRFYGGLEDAFIGLIGGGRTLRGDNYSYNMLYGRKQFILADGFLLINTSMNGDNRAALQLNPRWAAKDLFQASFKIDRLSIGAFHFKPNELPILNSNTTINGINVELGSKDRVLIGASFLHVPRSTLRYFLANGDVFFRRGLQVYNIRLFINPPQGKDGLFFKTEGAYQRNSNFNMGAFAFYGEAGWRFTETKGAPSIGYRFAYFSGDNPSTSRYERWDALYTGGNGEQWVQGSNMYKMVQNSNELSHRLQAIYNPMPKLQLVMQLWLFYAPRLLNLGGNAALSNLSSHYLGSEVNLTVKYFKSRNWYFHLNTAYTFAGSAITENVEKTKNWFCLSTFVRYSF